MEELQDFAKLNMKNFQEHIWKWILMVLEGRQKKKNQTGKKETKSKTIQLGWFINMDVLAQELISWFKYLELP